MLHPPICSVAEHHISDMMYELRKTLKKALSIPSFFGAVDELLASINAELDGGDAFLSCFLDKDRSVRLRLSAWSRDALTRTSLKAVLQADEVRYWDGAFPGAWVVTKSRTFSPELGCDIERQTIEPTARKPTGVKWTLEVGPTVFIDCRGPDPRATVTRFPHSCPRCGSPAYVGFSSVECSRGGCA